MADKHEKLEKRYSTFAKYEAKGRSKEYYDLANWVLESDAAKNFILKFPIEKWQPNLIFASIRKVCGVPMSKSQLEGAIQNSGQEISELVLSRRTQTNEPARCAGMFMALSKFDKRAISLIEIGASAGLCLIPDYYQYQFSDKKIVPKNASVDAPILPCGFSGVWPGVEPDLDIVWRKGVDLDPIDLSNNEECDWLETLVWPGQESRLERLQVAIREAKKHNLKVDKGHLLDCLEDTITEAPAGTNIVVYHSAVMNYLEPDDVQQFRKIIDELPVHWLFQEDIRIFPDLHDNGTEIPKGRFVLALDGEILAHTHTHGEDIVWL
jgi:hypothetical protein